MASVLVRAPGRPFSLDPLIAEAHRRARRRRWLLACVLVVATAAIAAFELRSTSASGLAAAGRPVVHIVTEDSPSTVYFDLKTGRKTVKTFGEESWLDQQTGWHHGIMTEGGRRVTEQLWKAHYGPNTQAAAVDRFFIGLATDDYREALKNGMVKRVGRGTFEGHHVDWLRVVPRRDDRWYGLRGEEVGIDSQTFKPLLIRFASGKHYSYTRILLAQAIAYNPADFKRRGGPRQLPPYRGQLAPGYAFGSTDSSAAQTTVVHGPWLTAGTTVAGLELRAVTPFTIRRSKHHFSYGAPTPKLIHGLELVYGPASQQAQPTLPALINLYGPQWEPGAATRDTTVYEVPRAPRVPPWSTVPADSIQVQTGLTTLGSRVVPSLSIGYLKERGLYVTIRTPQGQQTALRIARSLRAAGK
jgi:hypothetical protein